MHLKGSSVHLLGRGTFPFYLIIHKPCTSQGSRNWEGREVCNFYHYRCIWRKIQSNDDHDDDSDDASTFAFLTFVVKFGGENNQEKDNNYDGDIDDDSDCCEHACIFNLYRYIWRREQPGRW